MAKQYKKVEDGEMEVKISSTKTNTKTEIHNIEDITVSRDSHKEEYERLDDLLKEWDKIK